MPKHLPERRLRVGFVPGVTPDKWARRWAERHPRSPLDLVPVDEAVQRDRLLDGSLDACFVRGEIDREGLHLIRLYEEASVVVVGRDNPVSVLDEVTMPDLAEEHILVLGADLSAKDAIATVASGTGVVVLPHSVARLHRRKDTVVVPVTDVAPIPIALTFTRAADGEQLQELVAVVRGRTARSSRG